MRAFAAVLVLAQLAIVRNAVISFTGNITRDFTTDYFTLPDRRELQDPCGFDILDVVFSYDKASDTGYFGERLWLVPALHCGGHRIARWYMCRQVVLGWVQRQLGRRCVYV